MLTETVLLNVFAGNATLVAALPFLAWHNFIVGSAAHGQGYKSQHMPVDTRRRASRRSTRKTARSTPNTQH